MTQTNQKISRERRKELRKRLDSYIGPHHKHLQLAAFFGWIQFLMRVLSFALIAQLIQQLYLQQSIQLWLFVGQLVLLNGIGFVAAMFAKPYQGLASQHARNQLKQAFFEVFQARQGEFDSQTSMADILMVAAQGIDTLDTYYHLYKSIALRAYMNCATVLLVVAVMFPLGGAIFLVSLPFIPVSIMLIQKRSKAIMQRYWGSYLDVGNLFLDNLKGMNTLYAYQADARYAKTFAQKAEEFRSVTMELLRFQLQSVGYMDAVMYLGVGISGFFAVQAFLAGNLTLWSVVFFVLIASEFFAPIRELGYCMHLLMMNTKMADRIFSFLDEAQVETASSQAKAPAAVAEVTFREVSFSFEDKFIVEKVSFSAKKGEIFAIAGESGRGKTTLAKLMLGHETPQDGAILFDEARLTQAQLAATVGYVSPSSYVFNCSIYDNLVMGKILPKEAVSAWLKAKGILSFIDDLPEGLDTIAGENGNQLSPGQRQQIVCARALLAQKKVHIFDEMTSSIDSDNEQSIFELIRLTAQEAVVMFISHKMKQVLQADRVLFMADEVQVGTPTELLESNQAFQQLVDTQAKLEAMLHA